MNKIIPEHSVLIPDEAQIVFKGQIFDVYQWSQQLFDSSRHTFEMLKRPDTVVAICIVGDRILVVNDEQPHFGLRKSFPGGRVDASDASIEAAARREVAEETGYHFNKWRLIKVSQPHLKIEWFVYVLLAWDATEQSAPHLDAGEKISVERPTFPELKELVLNKAGYLADAQDLLNGVDNLEQLLEFPSFSGRTVDR